jgi:hypothetical protein
MAVINHQQPYPNVSRLTVKDARRVVEICSDLAELCAKLTGEIDPAATALLRHVAEEILPNNKTVLKKINQSSS